MGGATWAHELDRREFLVRTGVLGAAVGAGLAAPAAWRAAGAAAELDVLAPALRILARDTIGGLVAFVVPGPDRYSVAQGVTTAEPGGIDADGAGFLLHALDHFFPLPDEAVRLLATALATGVGDTGTGGDLPILGPILDLTADITARIDDALGDLLRSDETVPLSLVAALLLNGVATLADPAAVAGPFPASPFANLPHAGKVEVFRLLEEETATVVGSFDRDLPEPLRQSLSGLVAFVAGALLEFAVFGSYSEWHAFDPATRRLTGVPLGWRATGYQAETGFRPVEGWDELRGYYEGRREVGS